MRTVNKVFPQVSNMAQLATWECPECKNTTHYKGLCRDCTEYDDSGSPVKPVSRVRINHTQTERHIHIPTKADFVNSRRKQPSKKQLDAIMAQLNANSHECQGEECPVCESEDFTPIGEIIKGEEEWWNYLLELLEWFCYMDLVGFFIPTPHISPFNKS